MTIPFIVALVASFFHVISGPDHLAAVTPLVLETQKKSWRIGFIWGVGHLTGMCLVGIFFLAFREYLPIELISHYSEYLIGLLLIAIGIFAFYKFLGKKHLHVHPIKGRKSLMTSLGIGFVHGFAGIAHIVLLLPVLAFEKTWESSQYIMGFASGTLIAMTLYAFLLDKFHSKKQQHTYSFQLVAGVFAVLVGVYWIYFGHHH